MPLTTRLTKDRTAASKRPAMRSVPYHPSITPISSSSMNPILNRKPACACGGSCPKCQGEQTIQPKLTIGAPNDKYEQEADRVADQVMRMPEPQVQRQPLEEEKEEEIQTEPLAGQITPLIQRQEIPEEEDEELLQTKTAGGKTPEVSSGIGLGIQSLQGSGQPLSGPERSFFEPRFGADFGNVRVHNDARAASVARSVNARAFTLGRDVVFGAMEYSPDSSSGRKLLAHELTHVVQQDGVDNVGLKRAPTPFFATPFFAAPRQAQQRIPVRERAHFSVQRQVKENNFPGGGKVETVRPGEFLLWNFDVGVDKLKSEHETEIPAIAKEINAALAKDSNWEVDIEGQASLTSTDAVNNPLSAGRAESVRAALAAAGVDAGRVKVTSVGSRKSLPSVSKENLARSRAVRVILVPKVAAPAPAPPGPTSAPTPAPAKAGAGPKVTPVTPTPERISEPTPEPKAEPPAPTKTPSGTSGTTPSATPCTVTPLILSLTGGTVTTDKSTGQVIIRAGDGTATNLGMLFMGLATISNAGCGELLYVQNVQPFREITYKDHTRLRQATSSWHLDTSNPYPSQAFPSRVPTSLVRVTNDSPSLGTGRIGDLAFTEGLINSVEIRDEFRMFLLFKPTGGSRQPLISATWTFVGQALNTTTEFGDPKTGKGGGTLELDTSVSRVIPSSGKGANTTQMPVLSPNVTGLSFKIDRGGLTTDKTFADLFEKILNSSSGGP